MRDEEKLRLAAEYLKDRPKTTCDPWPVYDARVMAVLQMLEDADYAANYEELDETAIESMTLEEIATMYTFLRRGERFCDGHIAGYIEDGTLYRLVRRHMELLEKQV